MILAQTNPTMYKRYVDAVVRWLQECMIHPIDPREIAKQYKKVQIQADVLLCFGLKPDPLVIRYLRETLSAVDNANKVMDAKPYNEDMHQGCLNYIADCQLNLRKVGIGFIAQTVQSQDPGVEVAQRLQFFVHAAK